MTDEIKDQDSEQPARKQAEEAGVERLEGTDASAAETSDTDAVMDQSTPADTPSGADSLERQLLDLKKEKDELYDRLLRKHADFENYRKRAERDKREYQNFVVAEIISDLLVILDNFERALSHTEEQSGADYRKGVELIYRQLKDVMVKKGLRTVESVGQPFDPNFHEAIFREERNDLPENTILEELQKGYLFRDKLLRPAMVKVSYRSARAGEPAEPRKEIEENDSINVE